MSVVTRANEEQVAADLPLKGRFAALVLSWALRLIAITLRWQRSGLFVEGAHWTLGKPSILTFWHGDQLMMPWAYRSRHLRAGAKELHALVSMHSDGRIAAGALGHLSIKTVNGSSSRAALRSLLQMRQRLTWAHVAITPDGPTGPIYKAKAGAVLLSSTSQAPIFPVSIVAEKFWMLKSWDKMFIPKPFSRVVVLAGEPYIVPPSLSREQLENESLKLEKCLNELKFRAAEMLRKPGPLSQPVLRNFQENGSD